MAWIVVEILDLDLSQVYCDTDWVMLDVLQLDVTLGLEECQDEMYSVIKPDKL